MWRIYTAVSLIILIVLLHNAFPYVLQQENARMRLLYLVLLLSLGFAGGRRAFRNRPFPRILRDVGIWAALFVVLIGAYGLRDEFGNNRLLAELIPSRAQVNGDGGITLRKGSDGHFHVEGEINGVALRFLIDTGASDIVLSPDDARRAGFDTGRLDYSRFSSTANGIGTGAPVTLERLGIGGITMANLPATVNKAWMQESLLGMSFLTRLKGFRMERDRLVLVP